MRTNLPVTQREYAFPAGQTLVSTTDVKGRILYMNPVFIEVSGYSREELLGQPHNLIRHPDMPEEAFRDMWATIQAGLPWSAAVKNRRKNGDHYWVMANVTALLDGDQIVGFMSVRTEASRTQIQDAETLYATMRAEKAAGTLQHTLHNGELRRSGIGGSLARLMHLDPPRQLTLLAALTTTAGAGADALFDAVGGGWLGLGLALGAGLAVVLLSSWRAQRLTLAPLQRLHAFSNRLAAGDLTRRFEVQHRGIIGQCERSLNQLSVNLMAIVSDARAGVESLRGTASELAQGNHDLSARTESQASSLEETASSMEQITGTVRQSAEAARGVAEFARSATDVTSRSAEEVHRVTSTMSGISQASTRIQEIIQVIDGIAFQTNILALNAAVEAARAGEQGRGFAVVASEVRSLAQRTSTAAREVKQLIEESGNQVQIGARQTAEAGKTMDSALEAVQRMSALVVEINTGASEQLSGISQVNEAVSHMDALTQQNAALVEELAAAASSVRTQSEQVAEAVRVFKLAGDRPASGQEAVALRRQMKQGDAVH
jgi:aerotaxis receptor